MNKKKKRFHFVDCLLFFLAAVVLALLLVLVVIPWVAGYESYVIASDSMSPTLRKGDVIQVKPVSPETLSPGQIVTLRSVDGSAVLTHRISYIDRVNGLVHTKGDANRTEDFAPAPYERVVGVLQYRIPYIGGFLLQFENKVHMERMAV